MESLFHIFVKDSNIICEIKLSKKKMSDGKFADKDSTEGKSCNADEDVDTTFNNEKKSKKQRLVKHDKKRSMKKKAKINFDTLCQEYDNFMLSNQIKKKSSGISTYRDSLFNSCYRR